MFVKQLLNLTDFEKQAYRFVFESSKWIFFCDISKQ